MRGWVREEVKGLSKKRERKRGNPHGWGEGKVKESIKGINGYGMEWTFGVVNTPHSVQKEKMFIHFKKLYNFKETHTQWIQSSSLYRC